METYRIHVSKQQRKPFGCYFLRGDLDPLLLDDFQTIEESSAYIYRNFYTATDGHATVDIVLSTGEVLQQIRISGVRHGPDRPVINDRLAEQKDPLLIEFSTSEALVLKSLLGSVIGPADGPRRFFHSIWEKLELQGIETPTYKNDHTALMVSVSERYNGLWVEWKNCSKS